MKKYLSIAALLGVIAFASVALLAQAEPQQTTVQNTVSQSADLAPAAVATADALHDAQQLALGGDAQKADAISPAAGDAPEKSGASAADAAPQAGNFLDDSEDCATHTLKPVDAKDTGAQDDKNAANADEQKAFMACMTAKGYKADDVKARLNDDEGGGDDPSSASGDDNGAQQGAKEAE